MFVCFPIETYLHMFQANTQRLATIRRYVQLVVAIATTGACVIATFGAYYLQCEENFLVLNELGLKDPDMTPQRVQLFCRDILVGFNFVIITNVPALFLFPLRRDFLELVVGKTVPFEDGIGEADLFILPRQPYAEWKDRARCSTSDNASSRSTSSRLSKHDHDPLLSRNDSNIFEIRKSADDAKAERKQFLARRAEILGEGSQTETTLEEVELRYSKRRFNWVLLTFADPVVEKQYDEFVQAKQLPLRRMTRAFSLAVVILVLICIALEGGHINPISATFYALAILTSVADNILCWVPHRLPLLIHVVLHHCTAILTILASGLMATGESIATNDVTYLNGSFMVYVGLGSVGLVGSATLIATNFFTAVVTCVLIWRIILVFATFVFVFLCTILIFFSVVIMEKHFRRQFLEDRVALFFKEQQQQQRNAEQRALLESIVPYHVVDELMTWLATDMDPRKTIVRKLDKISVAFVPLVPSKEQLQGFQLISPTHSHRSLATEDDTPSTAASEAAGSWLINAHVAVDRLFKRFPALDKIKTIGDVVMIAGSFKDEYSSAVAARQMLDAVWQLRTISTQLQAGIHVGEIVGAVLGTNRLCFDIFGDAVNVASRAMTTDGKRGSVFATSTFVEHMQESYPVRLEESLDENGGGDDVVEVATFHRRAQQNHSETTPDGSMPCFGGVRTVAAKGKGTLAVREVLSLPPLRSEGEKNSSGSANPLMCFA